jgi:hypothetical protein
MSRTATLAEVLRAGVTIGAEEAVAVVQQLIDTLRRGSARAAAPPYGPPTPDTVHLVDDGSVVCCACEMTPAVSEIAILLQAMLPQRTGVPGGLHYTIARALLDVDVPPFDSLDDFSETLTRYERGPRDQIVRRVLERFDMRRALVRRSGADRRRHPHTTELRRALREADARLYLQKVATEAVATTVALRPSRHRNTRAAAACISVGLLLIGAGELIDNWERATSTAVATSAPVPAAPALVAAPTIAPLAVPPRDVVLVNDTAPSAERRAIARDRRAAGERRGRSAKTIVPTARQSTGDPARKATQSRGMLERLRLNWLRNVLTSL